MIRLPSMFSVLWPSYLVSRLNCLQFNVSLYLITTSFRFYISVLLRKCSYIIGSIFCSPFRPRLKNSHLFLARILFILFFRNLLLMNIQIRLLLAMPLSTFQISWLPDFLSHTFSLSLSHTHTHTYSLSFSHTYSLTLTLSLSHTYSLSFILLFSCFNPNIRAAAFFISFLGTVLQFYLTLLPHSINGLSFSQWPVL